jgi:predicted GNAT family acetyltransferase
MDKKALIKALRDTAQSASNTIASGVSAPVDLIAAGLRKMGVPVPENALGGSRWMEDVGLTIPVQEGIPKTVGETLGMIVPMAATAKAPQIAAGANRAIENAMAPATLNTPGFAGQRGAIVWHGSPQKESLELAKSYVSKNKPFLPVRGGSAHIAGSEGAAGGESLAVYLDEINAPSMMLRMGKEKIISSKNGLDITKSQFGGGRIIKRNDSGEIVGALQYVKSPDSNDVILSNIYTRPDFRKQGIASNLVNELKKKFNNVQVDSNMTEAGGKFFGYGNNNQPLGLMGIK